MHKGIFITGTDTGVGKTYIAAGLIRAFKKMGLSVCPVKPVETGCGTFNKRLVPADALKLVSAAEADEPLGLINPYRFKQPLAPAVAAEHEGASISKKKIISACGQISKKYDITIVEGAGGIMVPVYRKYLFIDLMQDLAMPITIVARPGLGTINHTLLTIEAARSRGLRILGVIINCADRTRRSLSEKTNPEVVERLGGVPLLGIVGYSKDPLGRAAQKVHRRIAEQILSRS
ncbi:MAG: dethiobiotin synthase [Nitrospirota bacterium]